MSSLAVATARHPACMSDREFELWVAANRAVTVLAQLSSPCQECTWAFAREMRAEGRCDGSPGARLANTPRRQQWREYAARATAKRRAMQEAV